MPTYRLLSHPNVSAPGIIRWAVAHYKNEDNQASIRDVILAGWSIPLGVAHALLSEQVPYTIDGDAVVVTAE